MKTKLVNRHIIGDYGTGRIEHRIERVKDDHGWSCWRVRAFVSYPMDCALFCADFTKRRYARAAYRWMKRYRGTITYDKVRRAGGKG